MMQNPNHFISSTRLICISMLFVTFLILSNVTAFKIIELQAFNDIRLNFPAALIFFPLTYFFDDILTEVYGFKMSRLVIWCGLGCSALATLCSWIAVQLPASPVWDQYTGHGSAAFKLIFEGSARIFIASILAYFFGEFLNSIILAKLKVITAGKYFPLRIISSSIVGIAVDSSIFCFIAFWHVLPTATILNMVITIYCFKIAYEILMLPLTYLLVNYLKKAENIDYYDNNTRFYPFSISLTN